MSHPKANATSFKKGQSGNPKGRPKKVIELVELARASVPRALEYAAELLDDDDADPKLRLDAGKFLTSYGIGAPPKSNLEVDDDDAVQTSAAQMDPKVAAQVLKLVKGKGEPVDDK